MGVHSWPLVGDTVLGLSPVVGMAIKRQGGDGRGAYVPVSYVADLALKSQAGLWAFVENGCGSWSSRRTKEASTSAPGALCTERREDLEASAVW